MDVQKLVLEISEKLVGLKYKDRVAPQNYISILREMFSLPLFKSVFKTIVFGRASAFLPKGSSARDTAVDRKLHVKTTYLLIIFFNKMTYQIKILGALPTDIFTPKCNLLLCAQVL